MWTYGSEAAGVTESDWQLLLCLVFLSWGRLELFRSFLIWVPSDYVPTLDNGSFAIIITQPSNRQGEHWIMSAKFSHELYFADSLGRKGYSFLNNQHYKQMMPAPLQSHPSVCGFYTICAAFHLFKSPREETTGDHDVNVLSFISSYIKSLYVNVQFISCFCPFLYILINFFKLSHNLFT